MKKQTIFSIFIFTIASLFVSCSDYAGDFGLTQSIFIEDPENPGLPIYSEWGYNTFGAFIDRQPFTSTHNQMPAKIVVYPDTLNLIFTGIRNGVRTVMTFSFIGYAPQTYYDLIILHGETIDLTNRAKSIITLAEGNNEPVELAPFNGQFTFNRVQNLYVDKELSNSIISGRFRFQTRFRNEYITIDRGRFDFTMGFDNFYYIAR